MLVLQTLTPKYFIQLLSQKMQYWFKRRMRREATTQTLEARSTYILPTGFGVFFGFVLYCMLMGSINYSNSMGFLLTFLLGSICLVGMLYTYRNLSALQLTAGRTQPVFAGEIAEFPLFARTTNKRPAYQIAAGKTRHNGYIKDLTLTGATIFKIKIETQQRGYLPLGSIRVWSDFPLGFFHAWSWVSIRSNVLVYPKPSGQHKLPLLSEMSRGQNKATLTGNDDFAGIRLYQPGDSPNHIAWKAFARGHEVLTKQFSGLSGNDIWLDWDMLQGLGLEEKLSQLCQWVLDLHAQGRSYGLKLPDTTIEPSQGELHKALCLEKLALFNP